MTILDEFRRDDERVIDRLIDGELGLHERRELLAGLDDEPGAWRRCALAFLEAQSWRWQLSRMATEPILAQLATRPPASPIAKRTFWGGLLAIAASLAVAFAVGTRFPTIASQPDALANREHGGGPNNQAHAVAQGQARPAPTALATGAQQPLDASADAPWQTLTLTPVGGNPQDSIQLRVVDGDGEEASTLDGQRSAVSGLLLRRFEEEGFEVNRHERLLPIDLSDGRRVLVPIEEVDIRSPDVARL